MNNRLKELAGIQNENERREQLEKSLTEAIRQIPSRDLVYELADTMSDDYLEDVLREIQRKINAGYFDEE